MWDQTMCYRMALWFSGCRAWASDGKIQSCFQEKRFRKGTV